MLIYTILLFLLGGSSVVIVARLIGSSGKLNYNSNKLLLLILVIYSYVLIKHIIINIVDLYYNISLPINFLFNSSTICIIPILVYLYVKKIIKDDDSFNTTDIKHFAVFAIFYMLFELPFTNDFQSANIETEKLYWSIYFNVKELPAWLLTLRNLLNIFYTIATYILLHNSFKVKTSTKQDKIARRWLNKITHAKSSSKQIQIVRKWLYNCTHFKAIMTISYILFSIELVNDNQPFYDSQHLMGISIAFFIFMLSLFLNKNRSILFNLSSFMDSDSLKREKIKNEINTKEIYIFVTAHIKEDELYLKEEFNLNWLAKELGIKANYISIAITENNFENFSIYSNHFKIEKAKKLIKNNYLKNYSIEALASASGFRAVNTFYRIFKNETGLTPNMFAENIKKSN